MTTAELANEALAEELAERWTKQLQRKDWKTRLYLINDLYEYTRESLPSVELFCEVFPATVAKILHKLDGSKISCAEQAHIYANSGDAEHRRMAGDWFKRRGMHPPGDLG